MTRQVTKRFSDLFDFTIEAEEEGSLTAISIYQYKLPWQYCQLSVLRNDRGRLRMDGDADVTGKGELGRAERRLTRAKCVL